MTSPEISSSWVNSAFKQDGYEILKPQNMPESWVLADSENLTKRDKANLITLNLAADMSPGLQDLIDVGFGRRITGDVQGREEDDELLIDTVAEDLAINSIKNAVERFGLGCAIYTEHKKEIPVNVGDLTKGVDGSLDPVDNSDEYHRKLDTPQHLVFATYDPETNEQLSALDINLATGMMTINRDGKNYQYNPRTNELVELPVPEKVLSIQQRELTIASYFGRKQYSHSFDKFFKDLKNEKRHAKSTFHGKGGAHIYSLMATGAVSIYVMFDEPRGEIDPGLPFAEAAGYVVWEVDMETGEIREYKFDPEKNKSKENVPLFIAASTPELANEFVAEFMANKQKMSKSQLGQNIKAKAGGILKRSFLFR